MTTTVITLKGDPQIFPVGATVKAYLRTNWPTGLRPPVGAPLGSSAATATVASDGTIAFTGLTAGAQYYAETDLDPGGSHDYHYMRFTVGDATDLDPSGFASRADLAAQATTVDARYRLFVRTVQRAVHSVITSASSFVAQLGGTFQTGATSSLIPLALYIDDADLAISGRSTKLRVVAAAGVNDVAAGAALTVGLYPIGNPSGSNTVWNPNIGSVVAGSTVAFPSASLTANSKSGQSNSGDFSVPSAGWYALGVASDGAMTANSIVLFSARLEYRNV